MNSIDTLTTFFGWCTVINIGLICFLKFLLCVFHAGLGRLNAKFFGVTEAEAKAINLRVLMQYRLAFLMLVLIPYIALKIMV